MMMVANPKLGKLLKQQRVACDLTLQELSDVSGVSPSHLGRIENGQRFPSAHILHRIAGPLGFDEDELFVLAGYLTPPASGVGERKADYGVATGRLDPYVANLLAQETPEVQRAVIGILTMLKNIAKGLDKTEEV